MLDYRLMVGSLWQIRASSSLQLKGSATLAVIPSVVALRFDFIEGKNQETVRLASLFIALNSARRITNCGNLDMTTRDHEILIA